MATTENLQLQEDEVEALRALYGESNISFLRGNGSQPSMVSITLSEAISVNNASLSARLPSGYPSITSPEAPTIRMDGVSTSRATELIEKMLQRQSSVTGEVCLFEYVEATVEVLQEEMNNNQQSTTEEIQEKEEEEEASITWDLFHGEPLTDRKSVFQAHVARIKRVEDVDLVMQALRQGSRKIEHATHNMLAYRVLNKNGMIAQDCDDDGEKSAGKCMLHVLQQLKVVGVVCIVSRWYGGVKLGPIRFRHISKVTSDVLQQNLEGIREEVKEKDR